MTKMKTCFVWVPIKCRNREKKKKNQHLRLPNKQKPSTH